MQDILFIATTLMMNITFYKVGELDSVIETFAFHLPDY